MWTILDHTADLRVECSAPSWPELLEEAARAFGGLVCRERSATSSGQVQRELEVRGEDEQATWVRWWRGLHRLWTVEGLLTVDSEVDRELTSTHARGRVECVPIGELDSGACADIKAVTWHGADVQRSGAGTWTGRIVLDV